MTVRKLTQVIDACIIDLDGTQVDTLGDFEVALGRMLAELQLPPVARDFIERAVGKAAVRVRVVEPDEKDRERLRHGKAARPLPPVSDAVRANLLSQIAAAGMTVR